MLNKCNYLIFIFILISLITIPAAKAAVEDELANICIIVENNDKTQLRRKLSRIEKDYRLKLGRFYANLNCNNLSLLRFAVIHKSDDAGIFLTRKLSKSLLSNPENDGQSITEWATNNGYSSSVIIDAIIKRIN